MKKKVFILIIIIIVIGVIVYNNYSNDDYRDETERRYTHYLELEKKIYTKNELRKPLLKGDKIYALNYHNQEILVTNLNGDIISKYGGYGDSPKRNHGIRYFNINENESISIIDVQKNTLSKINVRDSLLFFHKFNSLINCGGQLNENTYVISHYNNDNLDFKKIRFNDKKQEVVKLDKKLYPKTEHNNLAYEGSFYTKGENDLFYIPYYNSNMVHIKDNQVEYFQTIYNPDPIKYTQKGDMLINHSVPHYYDVTFSKDKMFILSKYGFQKNNKTYMVVDEYNVDSKLYVTSILIEKDDYENYPAYLIVDDESYFLFYDEYMTINALIDIN